MLADLKDGSIDGYCIGDPWNFRAAREGHGFPIAGDLEIWSGHPGKVLGVREDWAIAYPNTHIALTKAVLEACRYCADPAHWDELSQLLSDRRYLGMKPELIRFGVTDPQHQECTGEPHTLFFGPGVNRPSRSEHLWILTQLARWSEIPFPRNYVEILERVCAVGVYSTAARELGLEDVSYQRSEFRTDLAKRFFDLGTEGTFVGYKVDDYLIVASDKIRIIEVDPAVPDALVGDPLRLGQVLINFANNAVKFTENGLITVETEILPEPAPLKDAHLRVPANRAQPIAARLTFSNGIIADFDWRIETDQCWQILLETADGSLHLDRGGADLRLNGLRISPQGNHPGEYPALYARMAELVDCRGQDVDLSPLQLVADAHLLGQRETVAAFEF